MFEEVAMPVNEMALPEIESGNEADVMRFEYAVSQFVLLYPDVRPVPPRLTARVPVVSERATPREEVAMKDGTAEPLVLFIRTELATAVEPNEVVLVLPVVVTTPERAGAVVTVAALPVMLIDTAVEVEIEANVLAPVA